MVIHLALYYSQVKYDTLRDTRSEHYYQLSFSLPTQFSSPHLQFFLRSSSFLSHDKKRVDVSFVEISKFEIDTIKIPTC